MKPWQRCFRICIFCLQDFTVLGWAASTSAHPACRLRDSWGKSILTCCLYSPCGKTTSCTMTGTDIFGSKCLWDITATFSPQLPQSGQNKETMITAVIQPFHTKLSRSAECQQFADTDSSISSPSPDTLLIYLHNPCDTPINNCGLICISMAEIEDRRTHSKYSPARNKLLPAGDKDLQGGGWTWSIFRFNPILTHTDRQCLQCTFQSPILC